MPKAYSNITSSDNAKKALSSRTGVFSSWYSRSFESIFAVFSCRRGSNLRTWLFVKLFSRAPRLSLWSSKPIALKVACSLLNLFALWAYLDWGPCLAKNSLWKSGSLICSSSGVIRMIGPKHYQYITSHVNLVVSIHQHGWNGLSDIFHKLDKSNEYVPYCSCKSPSLKTSCPGRYTS